MKLGFFSLLTIVFVIAKLVGWVNWSWWIVATPMIVGVVLWILLFLLLVVLKANEVRDNNG